MTVLQKDFCDIDKVHALVWRITTISPPPLAYFLYIFNTKLSVFKRIYKHIYLVLLPSILNF